jgi:3'-phosphoadenosine 5'-phosphosulfate sulfotransferase
LFVCERSETQHIKRDNKNTPPNWLVFLKGKVSLIHVSEIHSMSWICILRTSSKRRRHRKDSTYAKVSSRRARPPPHSWGPLGCFREPAVYSLISATSGW